MKVDRKQLITYPWLILFIILTVITVTLGQTMADKVFSSYDSRIIHERNCKELDFCNYLIEFPSVQQAVADGALPCKFCIGQFESHSGNQQSLISDTTFNPQTKKSEDTQAKADAINQPCIHQEEPWHKRAQQPLATLRWFAERPLLTEIILFDIILLCN